MVSHNSNLPVRVISLPNDANTEARRSGIKIKIAAILNQNKKMNTKENSLPMTGSKITFCALAGPKQEKVSSQSKYKSRFSIQ